MVLTLASLAHLYLLGIIEPMRHENNVLVIDDASAERIVSGRWSHVGQISNGEGVVAGNREAG